MYFCSKQSGNAGTLACISGGRGRPRSLMQSGVITVSYKKRNSGVDRTSTPRVRTKIIMGKAERNINLLLTVLAGALLAICVMSIINVKH